MIHAPSPPHLHVSILWVSSLLTRFCWFVATRKELLVTKKCFVLLPLDGHIVTRFHLKQQFMGNYLMLATINGKELKYIIRKGTPEYDLLAKTGQANITDAIKQELVVRFLLPKVCSKGITL